MQRDEYIKSLNLEPHQEGGWFRQVYTSDKQFYDEDSKGERFYYTSIYFLLDDKNCSHFHRLNHDEMWYYHDGQAITIHCISPEGKYYAVKLGKNVAQCECLQFRVPKYTIFASEVTEPDSFCLVSCVVSPGFDYHDFELLKKADLLKKYPEYKDVIDRLAQD
ncbi:MULTISPECIES: cupin domain-containing protein [Lactobacillus]|uniref:cupin domain-containing protein n=1 Tax=Lactobacillus TaxID=1578 RepID=UPI000D7012C1|nr:MULTISPECIES: cupin domain-containing protein [Lactobacillus]AWN33732.1 cupin [Lactobacillus helsingborgensis]MBI0110735.1 cupin domain-containing protein [Lactobacillus sp. W8093]RMC53189.1 cupin domain-containing protein [Lactobacillus sp. ESL0262]